LSDGSDPGAVSRWKLDDGGADGSTAVDSWGSNDGSIEGASFTDDSVRNDGRALQFNQLGEYVEVDGADISPYLNNASQASWSLWFRLKNPKDQDRAHLIGRSSGEGDQQFQHRIADGSELRPHISQDLDDGSTHVTTTDAGLKEEVWYHVVFVYDGGLSESTEIMKVYLNGVLMKTEQSGDDMPSEMTDPIDEQNMHVGGYESASDNRQFKGEIDDVRIFDRALSSWEVFELYRWGSLGKDLRKELVNKKGNGGVQ